jgi:hypothetical protein
MNAVLSKMVYSATGPAATIVRSNTGLSSPRTLLTLRVLSGNFHTESLGAMGTGHYVIPMPYGIAARLLAQVCSDRFGEGFRMTSGHLEGRA